MCDFFGSFHGSSLFEVHLGRTRAVPRPMTTFLSAELGFPIVRLEKGGRRWNGKTERQKKRGRVNELNFLARHFPPLFQSSSGCRVAGQTWSNNVPPQSPTCVHAGPRIFWYGKKDQGRVPTSPSFHGSFKHLLTGGLKWREGFSGVLTLASRDRYIRPYLIHNFVHG